MIRRVFYELGRAVRETGQQLDKIGLQALEKPIFKEPFSRHRTLMGVYDKFPYTDPTVWAAPNATVVGKVFLNRKSSVWYGAVIRGDLAEVQVGAYSNIQDRAVVYTSKAVEGRADAKTRIGNYVTIGPGAVLNSCTVEDQARIGAGATIMEGAVVESMAVVADGAVVHPGRRVPKGQLWAGSPAQYVRDLSKGELSASKGEAEAVSDAAADHHYEFMEHSTAYKHAEELKATNAKLHPAEAAALKDM